MSSEYSAPGGTEAVAKYRATKAPVDGDAQALSGPVFQWVLMQDVDANSGYKTPSPPKREPEYEGQIVAVPAAIESA